MKKKSTWSQFFSQLGLYTLAGLVAIGLGLFVSSSLMSRGEAQKAADSQQPVAGQAASGDTGLSNLPEIESLLEPFIYDPKGRRDPFQPFIEVQLVEEGLGTPSPGFPLQRYDLEQLQLVGIIWDVKEPKAMIIDPTKAVYTVGKDERIGRKNGYIASIREGEVVVVEAARIRGDVVYSTQIMKLAR